MWRDTQVACVTWFSDYEILLKLDLSAIQLVVFGLVLEFTDDKVILKFQIEGLCHLDELYWYWCGLWYSYNKVWCFTPLHSALFIWNWSWSVMDLMFGILNFWRIWCFGGDEEVKLIQDEGIVPSLISCTDTDVDYDTPITKFVVSLLFILRYSYETEVEVRWTWCLVSWTFEWLLKVGSNSWIHWW